MAGWGPALAIKLHGWLTQGCLGRKETHPSVSGCLLCLLSRYLHIFPCSALVVSSWPRVLSPVWPPPPDVSGRPGETLSAPSSPCSLSRAGWSPSSSPQCPRGQAHLYTALTTDSWCWHAPALRGSLTTKDSRACWHQRLGLERNYKELIPSRPFSSPTPTVPGLGAHIMLTLSQFWPVVFPGAGSWCAHPSSPLLTRPKN